MSGRFGGENRAGEGIASTATPLWKQFVKSVSDRLSFNIPFRMLSAHLNSKKLASEP